MDLKECADCGGKVSQRAAMCPHCGGPSYSGHSMPVTVVDFDIRLGNLIGLMVKTAIAVIPALIIVVTIGVIAWSALSSMLVGRHL